MIFSDVNVKIFNRKISVLAENTEVISLLMFVAVDILTFEGQDTSEVQIKHFYDLGFTVLLRVSSWL